MIPMIGRPVELVITVLFMHGVLGPIPGGIDECKRLAHKVAVHQDDSTTAPVRGKWAISRCRPRPSRMSGGRSRGSRRRQIELTYTNKRLCTLADSTVDPD